MYAGRWFGDDWFGQWFGDELGAPSTGGGYFGHRYFGQRHFGPRYFSPEGVPGAPGGGGYFGHRFFPASYFASVYYAPVVTIDLEPSTPTSGGAGGGTRVRFPHVPGIKPRDRRRKHEEDLLIVIL